MADLHILQLRCSELMTFTEVENLRDFYNTEATAGPEPGSLWSSLQS